MAYEVFNKEQKGKKRKLQKKFRSKLSDGLEETFFCLAQRGENGRRRTEQGRAAATWGMRCDARRECNATWLDASQTAAHNNGDEAAKAKRRRTDRVT